MIESAIYREVLSHFATGVTAVIVNDGRGGIEGFTASAFSAVSLDPPLVLVCLSYDSECYEPLRAEGRFTIHFLTENQAGLALAFANRELDKAQQAEWYLNERGCPVLCQALAVIECRLYAEHPGGDHAIFVGEVEAMATSGGDGKPLLYYRGKLGGKDIV